MASADRPYQVQSIESLRQGFREKHTRQVLAAPTGAGKCLGIDTPVLMADGTIKVVQDIVVGDALMGPDGRARTVLSVCSGEDTLYRITPKKGDSYVVNSHHILSLRKTPGSDALVLSDGSRVERDDDIVNVNVEVFARSNATARHCLKGWRSDAIEEFMRDDESDMLLPPYILGAWLGDGTQGKAGLSKPPCKMVDAWVAYGGEVGLGVRIDENDGECPTWYLTNGRDGHKFNVVQMSLDILGVLHRRFIPDDYKFSPLADRLQLLAGLIDSDGHISHGGCDWISKSETLAQDFAFVCRSVGLSCYVSKQQKGIASTGFTGWYWRCSVSGDLSVIPTLDKIAPKRTQKKRHLVHGITVEAIGNGAYFGFQIDGDHLFMLGDFTVTHNSVIMLDMIKAAIAKGSRICFICERRILVEQFSRHLDSNGIDHGIMMAKHWRFKPQELVQIATAQTLEKMETWPAFDICFIDEIHACMRRSIKQMMKTFPSLKVIGATATPFHPELASYFSSVTSVISMSELVEKEFLVPFRVFVAHEIDTTGVKIVAGEWQKDELEKRGQQIVGDVVTDYIRISNEVFGGYRKTICFSCGVAHGADLAQKFNDAGINAVQISANDEDDYRAEVLADFAKHDSDIKVLISVSILSRGFDQTDVEHVILARPLKKSFSEHVQMIGRGARSHPDKDSLDKKFCVIQDNSGNWLRFQESWDDFYNNGVNSLQGEQDKKPRKEPTQNEKEAAKCPRCGHLWTSGSDICSHCGAVRSRRNAVTAIAGEMTELALVPKREKYSPEYKEHFYAQLIGWTVENNKKPGMAFYKYQEKFGVQPSMAKPAAIPPGPEVMNWIRSRNIAWAKSQNRRAA